MINCTYNFQLPQSHLLIINTNAQMQSILRFFKSVDLTRVLNKILFWNSLTLLIFFFSVLKNILLNNASTLVQGNGDIICNNGIVHIIDTVLVPPVFSTDNLAAVLLERDDIFKEFFMYALLSNFTKLIESKFIACFLSIFQTVIFFINFQIK